MLLSAVSVLVVAQSIFEIPEGIMNNPVFTAKSLYMFRVSHHPSSAVLKTVTAASGTGHNTGTATSLQRGLIGTDLCEYCVTLPRSSF